MNDKEKEIIKFLNKTGVETRFISLYDDNIYINNLKFSKFSRKKEEEFHTQYPHIKIIRSTLFQKICIKVSRTVKDQIRPRSELYIPQDNGLENILLYIVLEPYKRKYGIKIVHEKTSDSINVSNDSLDDFIYRYMEQLTTGERIRDNLEQNTIYPLMHVPSKWMKDWVNSTDISYDTSKTYEDSIQKEIISFLKLHIPNVQESIKQSVNYLEEHNQY